MQGKNPDNEDTQLPGGGESETPGGSDDAVMKIAEQVDVEFHAPESFHEETQEVHGYVSGEEEQQEAGEEETPCEDDPFVEGSDTEQAKQASSEDCDEDMTEKQKKKKKATGAMKAWIMSAMWVLFCLAL